MRRLPGEKIKRMVIIKLHEKIQQLVRFRDLPPCLNRGQPDAAGFHSHLRFIEATSRIGDVAGALVGRCRFRETVEIIF